jgi:hypothetical protein
MTPLWTWTGIHLWPVFWILCHVAIYHSLDPNLPQDILTSGFQNITTETTRASFVDDSGLAVTSHLRETLEILTMTPRKKRYAPWWAI